MKGKSDQRETGNDRKITSYTEASHEHKEVMHADFRNHLKM